MSDPKPAPLAFLDAMMLQYPHWDGVFALQALGPDRVALRVATHVLAELSHPMVPKMVRNRAARLAAAAVEADEALMDALAETLAGSGRCTVKYLGDARNLAEAAAGGGRYFLTADRRLLERSNLIDALCRCRPLGAPDLLEILDGSGPGTTPA